MGGAAVLPATVAGRGRDLRPRPCRRSSATCPDGAAQVLVRPEQVRIDGSEASVEARIEEISFYGHDAAVRILVLPDGPALVARVPGLDSPGIGATVKAGIAGRVVAFPTSEPSTEVSLT